MVGVFSCWMVRAMMALAGLVACCTISLSSAHAGDWRDNGLKPINDRLAEWGVALSATYIGEALGNASGGIRRGAVYEGRFDFGVDVDLDKAVGWSGATFTPMSIRSTDLACRATISAI